MNTWEIEEDGFDMAGALWDVYYEQLQKFYSLNKKTDKEWEELSQWEVAQAERDFEWDKEQNEAITNPELFYGTAGTR